MPLALVRLLLVSLLVSALGAGCNRQPAAPVVVAAPEPMFRGRLVSLVPVDSPAWAYVDIGQLREWEPAGPLVAAWTAEDGDAQDVISRGLRGAQQWLVIVPDQSLQQRVHVVRTAITPAELAAEAITPQNFAGEVLSPVGQSGAMLWLDRASAQAATVAAQDLLVTGDYGTVRTVVHQVRTGSANSGERERPHVLAAQVRLSSLHRAALQDQLDGVVTQQLVATLQAADLEATLDGDLTLQLRIQWAPPARADLLRSLLQALPVLAAEAVADPVFDALLEGLSIVVEDSPAGPRAQIDLRVSPASAVALAQIAAGWLQGAASQR